VFYGIPWGNTWPYSPAWLCCAACKDGVNTEGRERIRQRHVDLAIRTLRQAYCAGRAPARSLVQTQKFTATLRFLLACTAVQSTQNGFTATLHASALHSRSISTGMRRVVRYFALSSGNCGLRHHRTAQLLHKQLHWRSSQHRARGQPHRTPMTSYEVSAGAAWQHARPSLA
jgi:hypothetical protein